MKSEDIFNFEILNPKRKSNNNYNFFSYYAGFSTDFALSLTKSIQANQELFTILDPWNGSGTTTKASNLLGFNSIGLDLNPVMVVVSKSNLLSKHDYPSLLPIARDIIKKVLQKRGNIEIGSNDPLLIWFDIASVEYLRSIMRAIHLLLINSDSYKFLIKEKEINELSPLAAFFYVAMFKTLRKSLKPYTTTNPTWIKRPKSDKGSISLNLKHILEIFENEVINLSKIDNDLLGSYPLSGNTKIQIGSSTNLNFSENSIDLVLTSPPYCTRIDYGIATLPELALLGFSEIEMDNLRRQLIGTSTVSKDLPSINPNWGSTCINFLDTLYNHSSKASKTYYFKNHLQYFSSIYLSVAEISKIVKQNGACVFVVQDSFYKNVHNNLSLVFTEMCQNNNLHLVRKEDFKMSWTMAGINAKNNKYRDKFNATESVLCYLKS